MGHWHTSFMVNTSFDVRVLDVEELISEILTKTAESNTCMAFCHVHVRKSMLLMLSCFICMHPTISR